MSTSKCAPPCKLNIHFNGNSIGRSSSLISFGYCPTSYTHTNTSSSITHLNSHLFTKLSSKSKSLVINSSFSDNHTSTHSPVQSCDHWRKNLGVLGKTHRVYAIDLIGYGYSDKPNPSDFGSLYTFETWGSQVNDFCKEVVQDEAFFICNSIGGLVGLQAAVLEPQICRGLVLLNISLRMLHITKQPLLARPLIKAFQNVLRNTALGKFFFTSVATSQSVRNILSQCYYDTSQVTDELVEIILRPGLQPGAVDVFLEFICYSNGPLPEELLPQVKCPVLIGWGDKDPWEPIELGRAYGNFDTVEEFVVLPDVGHCPQDEAPQLVNPLVEAFVVRHSPSSATVPSESLV